MEIKIFQEKKKQLQIEISQERVARILFLSFSEKKNANQNLLGKKNAKWKLLKSN